MDEEQKTEVVARQFGGKRRKAEKPTQSDLLAAGRLAARRLAGLPFDANDCPADSQTIMVTIRSTEHDPRLRKHAEEMLSSRLTAMGFAVLSIEKGVS